MDVVWMSIGDLRPYENNPRKNTGAIKAVAKSLKEFGFQQPIVVDENNVVIAGHTRLAAATSLGMASVPVTVAKMTPEQVKAYRIADNATAEKSSWDNDKLDEEVRQLLVSEFDVEILGLTDYAIKRAMGQLAATMSSESDDESDFDDAVCVSEHGTRWIMGDHWLECGSCLTTDWPTVDLVYTSPPYNIKYEAPWMPSGTKYDGKGDRLSNESYLALMNGMMQAFVGKAKNIAVIYQLLRDNKAVALKWLYEWANHYVDTIVIVKDKPMPQIDPGVLNTDHEYCWVFSGGMSQNRKIEVGDFRGSVSSVYQSTGGHRSKFKRHSAAFPLAWPVDMLTTIFGKAQRVADPFTGTGTTLIACQRMGRAFVGSEIQPMYCDFAVHRWCKETGMDALRGSDGASFADLRRKG